MDTMHSHYSVPLLALSNTKQKPEATFTYVSHCPGFNEDIKTKKTKYKEPSNPCAAVHNEKVVVMAVVLLAAVLVISYRCSFHS